MEMERFNGKAKTEDQGALALVLDLANALERVSLPVVRAWATHFSFRRKILRVLCGCFEHQRRVQFEGCAAEPLQTITAILPGSVWSCLLPCIVLQDALSEVTQIYPPLQLRVFVDDITAPLMGKNREVAEMAKKVMKKLKEEIEKKGLKLSVTENGKEGKSKMIASCGFLEDELRQYSKAEGVTLADSVGTLGVDLRTRVKRLGANEKARRKKCKVRFSIVQKNKSLPEILMRGGVKKLSRAGMMPARTWGAHAVGMSPTERLNIEETDGSCGGKKEYNLRCPSSWRHMALEVQEELSTMATQYWAEGVWTG